MNYMKIYDQLIQMRREEILKKRKLNDPEYVYCEAHHIIPKCLGGSDDKTNIILLTAREHYIAHLLLRRIYPGNYSLAFAVEFMHVDPTQWFSSKNSTCGRKFRFNGRLFQLIREANARIKSSIQSELRWIKNDKQGKQGFWSKDKPLTLQMIQDGWEFGRLPFEQNRTPESYKNTGYEAGKYIRITNEVEDLYILKDDPIPEGYHRGMSLKNRQHQSQACIGRKGTTTGKLAIVKDDLSMTRYISPTDEVPIGWHYGSCLKGTTKSEDFKKHLSEINKGKKLSKETKSKLSKLQKQMRWYTNGIENLRQNINSEIPIGFWPGRTLKSRKL